MHKSILQSRLSKPTPLPPEPPAPAVRVFNRRRTHRALPAGTPAVNRDQPGRTGPILPVLLTAHGAGGNRLGTHAHEQERKSCNTAGWHQDTVTEKKPASSGVFPAYSSAQCTALKCFYCKDGMKENLSTAGKYSLKASKLTKLTLGQRPCRALFRLFCNYLITRPLSS